MTSERPEASDDPLADLRDLEDELRALTNDWSDDVVGLTYDLTEDLDEDLADEQVIFEAHGYVQTIFKQGDTVTATYRRTAPSGSDSPAILIRAYRGKQQADALAAFEADALDLAVGGYHPVTQSWAPGQWGCGAFLVAILLCIVVVGLIVFIYMLLVKPDGTLTVTYQRRGVVAPQAAVTRVPPRARAAERRTLAVRLAELDEARDAGLISPDEYASRRAQIIEEA